MIKFAIAALIAVLAAVIFIAAKYYDRTKDDKDIVIPDNPHRPGIRVVWYQTFPNQMVNTAPGVDMYWVAFQPGVDYIAEMKQYRKDTVIDISSFLFDKTWIATEWNDKGEATGGHESWKQKEDQDAAVENAVRFFDSLRAEGVLDLVKVIYPMDEPNLLFETDKETHWALDATAKIKARVPEIANAKLGVIYMTDKPYHAFERYDIIGVDNYRKKSSVFKKGGYYDQIKARLKPGQMIWIVPGIYYDRYEEFGPQDPEPFFRYAYGDDLVYAVVVFRYNAAHEKPVDPEIVKKYVEYGKVMINGTSERDM